MSNKIEIGLYLPWMKEQVVQLFVLQYNVDSTSWNNLLENFYEHPFQKNKCIRLVALDGKKVVGFQSFFFWPYKNGNTVYNSYQSGNSLVHPEYRGKGIFQNLLTYIYDNNTLFKIDFMVGFPVEASLNSFKRNKWKNILNLKWYVKLISSLSIIFPVNIEKIATVFEKDTSLPNNFSRNSYRLACDSDFQKWRKNYSADTLYSYTFSNGTNSVEFSLKFQKRKKIINEIVIGDIRQDSNNIIILRDALKSLIKEIKKLNFVTIVSIATNPNLKHSIVPVINKLGFLETKKEIYFIIKNFIEDEKDIEDPSNWILYRSDIDTW